MSNGIKLGISLCHREVPRANLASGIAVSIEFLPCPSVITSGCHEVTQASHEKLVPLEVVFIDTLEDPSCGN